MAHGRFSNLGPVISNAKFVTTRPSPLAHCGSVIVTLPFDCPNCAISSYSAVIQLYIRAGQLDTALMRHNWLSDGSQPWYQFSCPVFKDPHHIFIHCPHFASLHAHSMQDLEDLTFTTLDTFSATPAYRQLIISIVQGLFADTSVWPLRQSLFYHGILPLVPGPTPSPQSPQSLSQGMYHV